MNDVELGSIEGLKWLPRWRMNNDPMMATESFVVPFPQLEPFNAVFHGGDTFDYGHYGIHLGQEDNLTFLGKPDHWVTARFYDARRGSVTEGAQLTVRYEPTSSRTLRIPPGVAHCFEGLERITTINNYRQYLPHPDHWEEQLKFWNPKADIVNITDEMIKTERPLFPPNTELAGSNYYLHLAERIGSKEFGKVRYPETLKIEASEGSRWVRLFQRESAPRVEEARPDPALPGVTWRKRSFVTTGQGSGVVPFVDQKPFYLVDHGFTHYSNDTYGIHVGQEDRLTFLGPSDQEFEIQMVDARAASSSWGKKISIKVFPRPYYELVIPQGVAHRFLGVENIFTLNQPRYRFDSMAQRPGLDTLDWDEKDPVPKLYPHRTPATDGFYRLQVEKQKLVCEKNSSLFSPTGYLTKNEAGRPVKAVLRKRA
jgi:dTDP-4-dehydrorhamnose 3,5-epimerase-like enzyme